MEWPWPGSCAAAGDLAMSSSGGLPLLLFWRPYRILTTCCIPPSTRSPCMQEMRSDLLSTLCSSSARCGRSGPTGAPCPTCAAVLEERQRISCNLHDGVAQELAYLARNLDSLEGEADEESLARLRGAVERAQLESRRAISALAAPSGQPFEIALAEAVTEVAERYHVDLDLDLTSDVWLSPARREALVRIACEAVTNAARHSGAGRISLGMERDGSRVRLWISDKGRGFDTGAPGGGFGLTSMRERARSVGGELLVFSAPGHGSEVEVAV